MATPNVGILTNAGKNLIDQVNAGKTKITFSKIVFSSMDNSQLSDMQVKALTAIAPQEVVVSSPQTTLDTNSGETRIRATGTNEKLADGVYVKTYGVFAKDDTGNEILYGVTVSPNPNYFPAYDGVTPQAVTYSYKTVIQETSNITMTNSNDVYVSQEDLTEAIAKIPQPDLSGYDKTDDVDKKLQNKQDKLGFTAADDSKVVHTADMRKPASDVVGLEDVPQAVVHSALASGVDLNTVVTPGVYPFEGVHLTNYIDNTAYWGYAVVTSEGGIVTQKIHTIGSILPLYRMQSGPTMSWSRWVTTADDGRVAHLFGANNFDTVPTVNNNPLLLASSLPSDLARTGSDQEFTGKNTFDTAPIDKTTGNPYITKDGVPSDVARTGQAQTFTAAQTFSIAPTITDASKDKGDNQAATMADLKSVEKSAWHPVSVSMANFTIENAFYKKDNTKMTYELFVIAKNDNGYSDNTKDILFQDPNIHSFGDLNPDTVYGEFGLTYASFSNEGKVITKCSTSGNIIYYENSYSGSGNITDVMIKICGYIHITGTFN